MKTPFIIILREIVDVDFICLQSQKQIFISGLCSRAKYMNKI